MAIRAVAKCVCGTSSGVTPFVKDPDNPDRKPPEQRCVMCARVLDMKTVRILQPKPERIVEEDFDLLSLE